MSCIYININGPIYLNQLEDLDIPFNMKAFDVMSTIIIEPDLGIVLFGIAMIISFYRLSNIPPSIKFDITARFDAVIQQTHNNKSYNEPKSPLLFSKNYSFRTFCIKMVSFVFFVFVVMGAIALFIAQISFIEIEYVGDISQYMSDPPAKRIYSLDGIVESVDIENNDGNTKFLRYVCLCVID